ncbi:MAG: protease PrsW [Candidatus Thermoplasmatota archaeon]
MEGMLFQASLFLGVIPALLLLYVSLKGYEGLYKDKIIFLAFIVGIALGFVSIIIESITLDIGVFFIILYPILEQMLKTMVLNIGRFQGKKETVIYGLTLGLGFGAISIPFSLISSHIEVPSGLMVILSVIVGSFSIMLVHAATGLCLGYGVYRKRVFYYLAYAILLHVPVTLFFFLTALYRVEYMQLLLLIYGLILYWYMTRRIAPHILPDFRRRQRRRNIVKKEV